jgi:hypothetical protein
MIAPSGRHHGGPSGRHHGSLSKNDVSYECEPDLGIDF